MLFIYFFQFVHTYVSLIMNFFTNIFSDRRVPFIRRLTGDSICRCAHLHISARGADSICRGVPPAGVMCRCLSPAGICRYRPPATPAGSVCSCTSADPTCKCETPAGSIRRCFTPRGSICSCLTLS